MTEQPTAPKPITVTFGGYTFNLSDLASVQTVRKLPRSKFWEWIEGWTGLCFFEQKYRVVMRNFTFIITEEEKVEFEKAREWDENVRRVYGMSKGLGLRG